MDPLQLLTSKAWLMGVRGFGVQELGAMGLRVSGRGVSGSGLCGVEGSKGLLDRVQ